MTLELVLAAVLRYPEVAYRLKEAVSSDLVVAHPFYRELAKFAGDFLDTYRKLPDPGDYQTWIDSQGEMQREGLRQAHHVLTNQDLSGHTPEYLATIAISELQSIAARTALARLSANPDIDAPTFQAMAARVDEVQALSIEGLADLQDVDVWAAEDYQDRGYPTGLPTLDRWIGGFRDELIFVMADSGVGKTTILINFAMAAATAGAHVLHLTLELATKRAANRYYRRMAEATRPEYRKSLEVVKSKVKHWWQFARGSIHVLHRPAYEITPEDLNRFVQLYVRQYGQVDVIVIDYLDLLAPSPSDARASTYEKLGFISHKIRNLCTQYDCTVLSATQATRAYGNRDHLSLSDMGDSYRKVQAADIIFGLVQSSDEEETHQARLGLLKVRENPGRGVEVGLYLNFDVMLVGDLHHPNTLRLMERFGHSFEPAEEAETQS